MKKKRFFIVLLVLVIIILGVLGKCIYDKYIYKNTTAFLLQDMEWGEEKDLTNLNLYYDTISLPVSLTDLDGVVTISNDYGISALSDLSESETVLGAKEIAYFLSKDNSVFKKIAIKNYSDKDITVGNCYNNGWWFIACYNDYENMFLLDASEESDASDTLYNITEYIGTPSYIMMHESYDVESTDREKEINYSLVYEYDDFTLEIGVNEIIESKNESFYITYAFYYNSEAWENEYESSYIIESTEINGVEMYVYGYES